MSSEDDSPTVPTETEAPQPLIVDITSMIGEDTTSSEEDHLPPSRDSLPPYSPHVASSKDQEMNTDEMLTQRLWEASFQSSARTHYFWSGQPTTRYGDLMDPKVNAAIEADVDPSKVRQEPYSLPEGFKWSDVDLTDPIQLHELYDLLAENYVEDNKCHFRFDYSPAFLIWALAIPGWYPNWFCAIRVQSNNRLVGFISCIPQSIRVYEKTIKMGEINFLCVHKRLRGKKVAPVLIREITRRANLLGYNQAVYTAGIVLPRPISCAQYFHRSLNPKKLIDVGFSSLTSDTMTLSRAIKLYKVPQETKTVGLRPLETEDCPQAFALLRDYLQKFGLAPEFEQYDFNHNFLPRDNVIYSYVVEENGVVTDFISFYSLPSTVMRHPTHKEIKAAYLYYYAAVSIPLKDLVMDCLILAKKANFDVFNALNIMDNPSFFEELKFAKGTGRLQYYVYNWRCRAMFPEELGMVFQ